MAAVFYGIDGCRGPGRTRGRGWIVVQFQPDGRFAWARTVASFAHAVEVTADAACVLVDIPIGLPDGPRACDRQARALLGPRRSSVFAPPARAALGAASYRDALAANRRATGRGLSIQAWHIGPRIADVDERLRACPELRARYRESHPEVCFAALDAWRPPAHAKRHPEGQVERLAVLARHAPDAPRFFAGVAAAHRRAEVSPTDILDAMVLAVAARAASARGFPTLPAQPPTDPSGLRVEMVCPLPPPGAAGTVTPSAGLRHGAAPP